MARRKKTYEDDDGRVVADMSGVRRRNVFLPQAIRFEKRLHSQENEEKPSQAEILDRKSARYAIFGATAAGLLIAGVFIVGLGIAILLMVLLWT